jgi:predicted acetyltransferase
MEIVPARLEDKDALLQLSEYYAYDFSDIIDLDVDGTGRFGTASFERHFADSHCHPFLIRVDGKLAGFAIHEGRSRLTGDVGINDVAEFFVMKRYRNRAVGARAAAALFDRFAGPWEVRELRGNVAAIAFWRKVIDRYTAGAYTELEWDDERFRGIVQRFNVAR